MPMPCSLRWVLLLLVTSVGCGHSGRPPLGSVSGTVKYNGQPIESGTLVFEVTGTRTAQAKIVDGQIVEATTYDPNDGVPVGLARIAVYATQSGSQSSTSAPVAADPGSYRPQAGYMGMGEESLIPPKFNDPNTSGLTWEIEKGQNELALDLAD